MLEQVRERLAGSFQHSQLNQNILNDSTISGSVHIGSINQGNVYNTTYQTQSEFVELSLEQTDELQKFIDSGFLNNLLEKLEQNNILVLSGSSEINKSRIARYVASKLVNRLSSKPDKIIEYPQDSNLSRLGAQIRSSQEGSIFLITQIQPNSLNISIAELEDALANKRFVVITTDVPRSAWQRSVASDVEHYWFNLDKTTSIYNVELLSQWLQQRIREEVLDFQIEEDINRAIFETPQTPERLQGFLQLLKQKESKDLSISEIKRLLQEADQRSEVIKRIYNKLDHREKLLAIGLAFFNGLFENQFFSALEQVVDRVWQKRDSSLKALDYEDLINLQETLFNFVQTRSTSRQVELNTELDRYYLFQAAWGNYQRQIINALPIIKALAEQSIDGYDADLYGSSISRQKIRSAVSEILSDLGRVSYLSVENILLELAGQGDPAIQSISAYAIARWRESEGKESPLFFKTIQRWQEETSYLYKYVGAYLSADYRLKNTQENNLAVDLAASERIQSTLALVVTYASLYDDRDRLAEMLCDLARQLIQNQSQLVRGRVAYIMLPSIIPSHLLQLNRSGFLLEIIQQKDDTLIDGLGISLGLAYRTRPKNVLDILETWQDDEKVRQLPDRVNKAIVTERDALLLTIARTYGELDCDESSSTISQSAVLEKLCALLRQERHPKIRQMAFQAIEQQILRSIQIESRQTDSRENFRQPIQKIASLTDAISRNEHQSVAEILTKVYLKQRKQSEAQHHNPKGDATIQVQSETYAVWKNRSERPTTEIEKVLVEWAKDTQRPLTQQLAIRTKTNFSKVFDLIEENKVLKLKGDIDPPVERFEPAEKITPITLPTSIYFGKWVPALATKQVPQHKTAIRNLLPEALFQRARHQSAFLFALGQWQSDPDETLKTIANRLGVQVGTGTWWADNLKLFLAIGVVTSLVAVKLVSSIPSNPTIQPEVVSQDDCKPVDPIAINPNEGVTDSSPSWEKSKIIAQFSQGASEGDVLDVCSKVSKNINISNGNVRYNDQEVAHLEGGTNNQPLVVVFNKNVDRFTQGDINEAVNAILLSVGYRNTASSPQDGSRTVTLQVIDSEGIASTPRVRQIYATSENRPPEVTLQNAQPLTVRGGDDLSIGGINVKDLENQNIEVVLESQHGTITVPSSNLTKNVKLSGSGSKRVSLSGSIDSVRALLAQQVLAKYKSDPTYDGSELIQITVKDSGKEQRKDSQGNPIRVWKEEYLKPKTTEQRIAINVAARNQPPTISLPAPLKVKSGQPIALGGLSIKDPDDKSIKVTLSVENGKLAVKNSVNRGVTISSNQSQSVTLQGDLGQINTVLSNSIGVIYQSKEGFYGNDTMTVQVNDSGKGAKQSLTIQVERVNTGPQWKSIVPSPSPIPSPSPSPAVSAQPGLSQSEAIEIVRQFIRSKSRIYGSSYDMTPVFELTTGKYQTIVLNAVNDSKARGEYVQYGNQNVNEIGEVSGDENEVFINVFISESWTTYRGNKAEESDSSAKKWQFVLRRENGGWKIAARKEL